MKKTIGTISAVIIGVWFFVLFLYVQNTQLSNGAKISHEEMQQAIKNHAIVTYGEYNE